MGSWGPGNFENDDALDLLGELSSDPNWKALTKLFQSVSACGMQGEEIVATDSSRVMAAAELLAASRGHPPEELPEEASKLLATMGKLAEALVEEAASAVSYVLMNSELVELWAESDDPGEWNRVASGLVARLDSPARERKISRKKQEKMTAAVCSFCGELISTKEFVSLDMRRAWSEPGVSRGIFAHESCLNSKLHPRHIVQWWTRPDIEP